MSRVASAQEPVAPIGSRSLSLRASAFWIILAITYVIAIAGFSQWTRGRSSS